MAERKVEIRVSVDDLDANKRLDTLALKLKKLSEKPFMIRLKLDDGGTAAKLDKIAAKLDKISTKTYEPKIKTDGITKADAQLDKFNAKLDRISHRRVTATVSVRTDNNTISRDLGRMLGGGGGGGIARDLESAGSAGGGAGSAGGGLLSALGGANNSYFGGLIAALIAYASAIGPAIIPFGIGGLVGGGASLGALAAGAHGNAALHADRQALARAEAAMRSGNVTPLKRVELRQARQALAVDRGLYGPFQPFGRQFTSLKNTAFDTFAKALTSTGPGFSGGGPGGTHNASFLSGLTGIIKAIAPALKAIGPELGQLFRASIPFVEAFAKIMEKSGKTLIPVFTQALKQLTPYIPMLVQGFVLLLQGVAGFIKNLGPGMKSAAIIFKGSMLVVKGLLQLIGLAASDLANGIVKGGEAIRTFARNLPRWFDKARHETAVIFDGIRHEIAHVWDMVFSDTIGNVERMVNGVTKWDENLRHSIANIFDGIRHDIAHYWDMIWNNTVGRVQRGINDVNTFFKGLPGKIGTALGNLGSKLGSIARTAMSDFWTGLKTIGKDILGWVKTFFTNIPHDIMSWLHMSPPHPGSAFYDLGANFMHHLSAGMQARAQKIGFGAIAGGLGAKLGGSVRSWILAAMHAYGAPMSWLPALQRLVSLESGGNPNIVNRVAVDGQHASGLWQMLPSTFYAYGGRGSLFNPVIEGIAALRYIASRYGSPFNIPGLFSGGYRGYAKGGILTEPVIGMGLHSGVKYAFGENAPRVPEAFSPVGAGGGGNIYINVNGDTNPNAAAFRIWQLLRQYRTTHGNIPLKLG